MTLRPPHSRLAGERPARGAGRGFSLAEMVLAAALMAVLLGSMVSVITVTTRAVPGATGAAPSVSAASAAVTQMAEELRTAVSFTQRTGTAVGFTVPDRNADGTPDPVRYEWSGAPGAPLVRTGRGGVTTTLLPSVQALSLTYTTASGARATTAVTTVGIVLQVGPSAATAVRTSVVVMNAPSAG